MKEPDLSRFVVILCRAKESGNVGSVCRAMKTMGIFRLVLAACPEYDEPRLRTMAVHAADLFETALRFPDLPTALAGVSLSAGFSRRRGERRKSFSLDAEGFAKLAAARPGGDIALVFGNEKNGLSDAELAACSLAVHIPSSELFPSLNLAQAVQIACYEVRKVSLAGLFGSYTPVSHSDVDATVLRLTERLESLGFFRLNQGDELKAFLRDTALRAAYSPAELRYFEAFVQKMAGLAAKKAGSESWSSK